jgi:hypothetical protein
MTMIDAIFAGVTQFEKALADSGTSMPDLGSAVEKAMTDLKSAAASGVEEAALDVLEAAFPQLKLFVAAADAVRAIPGFAPADVDSPVRRATENNPYGSNPMGVDDDDE